MTTNTPHFLRLGVLRRQLSTAETADAHTSAEDGYPAAPWAEVGNGFIHTFEVPVEVARPMIPDIFEIVETKPGSGVTQGSIYLAKYEKP